MRARLDTRKLDRAFFKSQEFGNMVSIGAAAFAPRLSGGFARLIDARQGTWPDLNPVYKAYKLSKGYSGKKWVQTGRTKKALSQGRIDRERTSKGIRYKIRPSSLVAVIEPRTFAKRRKPKTTRAKRGGSKYKGAKLQERIGGLLEFHPQHGRRLFEWTASDRKEVEASIATEIERIIAEGLDT